MKSLFAAYRILALVVGVLLIVGVVGSAMKYGHELVDADWLAKGSDVQRLGDDLGLVWLAHGWIYMIYVVVAFVLSQKARWSIPQFLLMMIAGLVPGLIFWVEARVARQLRAEHPELQS